MAHGGNTQFEWLDGTPKWDDGRKKVWLKWKWKDDYFTGRLTQVLDHFEIQIRYSFKNANGGIETQQKSPESMSDFRDGDYNFDYYWDVPADCLTVEFAIHAIAKTNSQNGGSVPYFEDDPWPAPPFYCGDATVPDKPSAPSVSHNAQIGTQVVLGLDNVRDGDNNQNVVQVEFQTVYYNTDPETELGEGIKVQRTEKAKVDEFGNARALVYIGNKYGYKFRARLCGVRDKDAGGTIERQIEVFSEWSDLTDIVLGVPERPSITVRKYTDVTAEYQIKAKNPYDHYQIQSAQTIESFDLFDDWEREYPQFKENGDERTAALQNCGINERSDSRQNGWINVTSLEAGKAYWRVRSVTAQSDGFYSTWSEPFELTFGEQLRAPIVSMGSQFANLDDNSIRLIIRHNSPNGSPTCRCDIHLRVGAGGEVLPWFDTIRPEDMTVGQNNDGSYTYYYDLNLKDSRINLQQEDTITWYAYTFEGNRAAESMETRSPHSEHVTFWVYEKPSVELAILSQNGESMPVEKGHYILPGFPIRLVTTSNLGEKKVVSWNIRIIPTISYYNTGRHGEREVVNAGSVLYNQIDVKTPTDLDKLILANEVSLDQGVVYILEVTAAINTGVTVSTTAEFKMVFTGAKVSIECASSYNFDNISLGLCPSVWKEEGTGLLPPPSYEDEYWVPSYIGGSIIGTTYNGDRIWNVGDKTYYSYRSKQCEFDRENNEWIPKTWYGLTSFDGYNIWTDGENIYCSNGSSQYVLNVDTDTWVTKTWSGLVSFYRTYIWTDGTDIYYSNDNQQYVLNKETSTWVPKTWYGMTTYQLSGRYIWTDGESFYFSIQTASDASTHYVLDAETSTWSIKTWEGDSFFTGDRVWTDGYNVYVSCDQYGFYTNQSRLNKDTDTWESITWEVHEPGGSVWNARPYAGHMWRDNGVIYLSSSATHLKFVMPEPEPEPTTVKVLDPNYTLAVYRKNDDGTFVTIAENLINTEAAFVTDPHPNLGGSEYRIVATDTTTGQMIFYDPPPYDMKCTDIILQWDEEYADIPFNDDSRETIRQFGSFVRLPYNIDVSESANMENSMVNYIGRKNPVSYYGTQTGYTASWSTEIPKYDTQTIKMLRRLQVYPGDVYVREPSGTGYWAHVTVTFPINHCALTVSVSLSVTRVEGGM